MSSNVSNIVSIGIDKYNKSTDGLMVFKNTTFINNYNISSDSKNIIKTSDNWNGGLDSILFDFIALKNITIIKNETIIITNVNNINIGITGFDKTKDSLLVFKNSVYYGDYNINSTSTQIIPITGTWDGSLNNITFNFIVLKNTIIKTTRSIITANNDDKIIPTSLLFNSTKDTLLLFKNSIYYNKYTLEEGYKIRPINGIWNASPTVPIVFDFVILKNVIDTSVVSINDSQYSIDKLVIRNSNILGTDISSIKILKLYLDKIPVKDNQLIYCIDTKENYYDINGNRIFIDKVNYLDKLSDLSTTVYIKDNLYFVKDYNYLYKYNGNTIEMLNNNTNIETILQDVYDENQLIPAILKQNGKKIAPRTFTSQVFGDDGKNINDYIIDKVNVYSTIAINNQVQSIIDKTPVYLSDLLDDNMHRVVTDTQINTWNSKASTTMASTSVNGLMSSTMFSKLNGIADNANNYSLPIASASVLGGVKIGDNININNGIISVTFPTVNVPTKLSDLLDDVTHRVVTDTQINAWNSKASTSVASASVNGLMSSTMFSKLNNLPDSIQSYSLPIASASVLGGIKVGSGFSIDSNGIANIVFPTVNVPTKLSDLLDDSSHRVVTDTQINAWNSKASTTLASASVNGLMSSTMFSKLNNLPDSIQSYSLPIASTSVLGGVKIGDGFSIDSNGIISISTPSIQLKSVTITTPATSINMGISGFDSTKDSLFVFRNSVFIFDYNISGNLISNTNGTWDASTTNPMTFIFVVLKNIKMTIL